MTTTKTTIVDQTNTVGALQTVAAASYVAGLETAITVTEALGVIAAHGLPEADETAKIVMAQAAAIKACDLRYSHLTEANPEITAAADRILIFSAKPDVAGALGPAAILLAAARIMEMRASGVLPITGEGLNVDALKLALA